MTYSCVLTGFVTAYIAIGRGNLGIRDTLHLFGWWPLDLVDSLRSLALLAILFAGPLFERAAAQGQWRYWIRGDSIKETLNTSIGWRNYVAVSA